MKVLGVGDDKYICEISYDEIYPIIDQEDEEDFEIQPGQEIDLERVLRAAAFIHSLDKEYLRRLTKELQMALAGVERVKATVNALTLFDTLKDENL